MRRLTFCRRLFVVRSQSIQLLLYGGTHSEASWEKQLPFVFHTLLYEVEE